MTKWLKAAIRLIYEKYLIKAMSSMAFGLFASLIVGVLITQLAKIPALSFLSDIAGITQDSYIIGAAIGASISYGFNSKPLVIFASGAAGAMGYKLGGPLGAYFAVLAGTEIAGLVAGKTPVDIIISPFVTIIAGGLVAQYTAPYVGRVTTLLGEAVNNWTSMQPFFAGILIAMIVGMTLTSPISSAGLCAAIKISGIASGAALVGCAAQMVGFAAASFKDNGVGGLISQGVGTSKLQLPNVLRHPQIIIAPTLAGAILGPVSTCIFKLEVGASAAAGMGTCGLVGPISALGKMGYSPRNLLIVTVICIVAPAIISYVFHRIFKAAGLVKDGYMKLTV